MRISYVGNRNNKASDGKSFNTENHIALTLEKLGHEVNFIQEDEIKPNTLPERVRGSDLFLWTRTWKGFVTDQDLKIINEMGIKTVSFHLDKYAGIKRDGGIGEDTFWKTNFVFSPEGSIQSKKIFNDMGIHQYYLPAGVFEDECYIAKPVEKYKHDVVFVGNGSNYMHPEWGYRAKLVKWLEDTYSDRFAQYGGHYPTVRGEELNKLYASSKIVIGDSLCKDFMDSYYYSDRCFEVTGRGGFLITPYIAGIQDHFVDRKEAVFYSFDNFIQLKNMIDYYLEHDDEREAIRRAGFERTKKDNTYTNRMETMLGIVTSGEKLSSQSPDVSVPCKINLGCGSEPTKLWINVDQSKLDGVDVVQDLSEFPWPFEDNSADEIKAIDVLEHIDTDQTIKFIEECHRILQPDGKLFLTMPHWQSKNLWIDPTHKRGYDEKSMDYFDPDKDFGKWYGYYSDCKFKVDSIRTDNDNCEFTMRKI